MSEKNPMVDELVAAFVQYFNTAPIVVKSPGRINLIGEHTDYNDGFVLPAAIDKAIYVAVQKNGTDTIRLQSVEYGEHMEVNIHSLAPLSTRWPNYILGVASQLQKRGFKISGFDLAVHGDVPLGAGLSSSAAVECATVTALNELYNLGIEKLDQVKIAQKAEHEFAGVMCGIMDQFASVFGKKDHVIKLDCRSLAYEYVPLKLDGYKVVLMDTHVKHSLASSEYNTRRQECEAGVVQIQKKYPHVKSLRDATPDMVESCLKSMDEKVYKRCRFIVAEIDRLQKACIDLEHQDLSAFGSKMFETHDGLSKEYEVSCKELDFLVEQVRNTEGVAGARMMGGGFGGCTINLMKSDQVDPIVQRVGEAYTEAFTLEMKAYVVSVEDGSAVLK